MILALPQNAFFGGVLCTRVDRYRATQPVQRSEGGRGSGVRGGLYRKFAGFAAGSTWRAKSLSQRFKHRDCQ